MSSLARCAAFDVTIFAVSVIFLRRDFKIDEIDAAHRFADPIASRDRRYRLAQIIEWLE